MKGKRRACTNRTAQKRELFLTAMRAGLSVAGSAAKARFSRRSAYDWREADPEFARDWDSAVEDGTDALEDEARRRAHDGVPEPVFYKGAVCGSIQKYSDTLLIFLLNGRRPEKFKRAAQAAPDNGNEIIITGGLPEQPPEPK